MSDKPLIVKIETFSDDESKIPAVVGQDTNDGGAPIDLGVQPFTGIIVLDSRREISATSFAAGDSSTELGHG